MEGAINMPEEAMQCLCRCHLVPLAMTQFDTPGVVSYVSSKI